MTHPQVAYEQWLLLGKKKPSVGTSPFYSRIYAGYSAPQLRCILENIEESGGGMPIFDPMAGQAFALSTLSWYGHEVRINDINPAPLLLAWLRSGPVLYSLRERVAEYRIWLSANKTKIDRLHITHAGEIPFITTWLSKSMLDQLREYGELACENITALNLMNIGAWEETVLFRLAVLVLASRRITCYVQSDNRTWLKSGGLDNKPRLTEAILQELNSLLDSQLSEICRNEIGLFGRPTETLKFSCTDISKVELSAYRNQCISITSPPYANRLDYSVMWGPELWVLSAALPFIDRESIQRGQIGTTRIRPNIKDSVLNELPASTQQELRQIERSNEYASKSYYFPFFRQFAEDLYTGLLHSTRAAPKSKQWIVFIRDTARKDVMFSSHAICEAAMNISGFRRRTADDLQIIKNHVGVMRRAQSNNSIHGLAQREWWLVFDRED